MDEEKITQVFSKRLGRIYVLAAIFILVIVPITLFLTCFKLFHFVKILMIIVYPIIMICIIYNFRCPKCGLPPGSFVHLNKTCDKCGAKLIK
ncbi:hypothetical protein JYG23_02735 [Sedimentibacter sp. zth1]|uniref:hypothetical protein n=1 Tax=Sedimentibacter sp. zth1 TaxID=2816908 RepID=UPI001A9202CA|nr:hypothetical protein [Sedimentibacter sp. zth1]QSX06395.1 hypothetical protein JYG23_02735 [Sedimentibacter sp. zth1]